MQKIENPYKKAWGDQPEISAMSKMLGINISVYQEQGATLTFIIGASHKVESSDTEICLLYTQAMTAIGLSNPNNHYNYLLQEKDLPTNSTTLQNKKITTEISATIFKTITPPVNLINNINNGADVFSSESPYVAAFTAKDSSNKSSATGAFVSSNIGIFYSLPEFKKAKRNISNLAKNTSNILTTFNAKRMITNGITHISNVGVTRLVNNMQQLSIRRCSLDGSMRVQ